MCRPSPNSARTSRWHSLHRRDGTYRFGHGGALAVDIADEEGFTQLAVVQPADDPTRTYPYFGGTAAFLLTGWVMLRRNPDRRRGGRGRRSP